jgi:hypothetical protein
MYVKSEKRNEMQGKQGKLTDTQRSGLIVHQVPPLSLSYECTKLPRYIPQYYNHALYPVRNTSSFISRMDIDENHHTRISLGIIKRLNYQLNPVTYHLDSPRFQYTRIDS